MIGALTIPYTAAPDLERDQPDWRITLEPETAPSWANGVTLDDLEAMLAMARSGLSARMRQRQRCPWATINSDGTIAVELACHVWPSHPEITYTLAAAGCTVGPAVPVQVERELDLAVQGASEIDLPWRVEGVSAHWQIPCVDEWCRPVASPAISADGATLRLSGPCWGVLRLRATAVGFRHTLGCSFVKRVPTGEGEYAYNRIDARLSVTAAWADETGAPQTTIEAVDLPACVQALLEMCPAGDRPVVVGEIVDGSAEKTPVVYFNSCTGAVLGVRYE